MDGPCGTAIVQEPMEGEWFSKIGTFKDLNSLETIIVVENFLGRASWWWSTGDGIADM